MNSGELCWVLRAEWPRYCPMHDRMEPPDDASCPDVPAMQLLGQEVLDETDQYVDNEKTVRCAANGQLTAGLDRLWP